MTLQRTVQITEAALRKIVAMKPKTKPELKAGYLTALWEVAEIAEEALEGLEP